MLSSYICIRCVYGAYNIVGQFWDYMYVGHVGSLFWRRVVPSTSPSTVVFFGSNNDDSNCTINGLYNLYTWYNFISKQ